MAEELSTLFSSEYAVVEKVDNPIDYASDYHYRKLGRAEAAQISGLMQFLPEEAITKGTETLYRIEFPAGANGYLSRHGSGYLSSIHDYQTGEFIGHATFVKAQQSLALFNTFQALSIVTSQYYLHAINQQLSDIQSKLDKVLEFLYDDKACEIYAEVKVVQEIYENYSSIMQNETTKLAALTAVQRARTISEKNIQFYYRDMNRLASEIKPGGKAKNVISSLRDDLGNYNQAMNLFGICTILEVLLGQNYDKSFLDFKEKVLNQHFNTHNIVVAKLQGKLETLKDSGGGVLPSKPSSELVELIDVVSGMLEEKSPVKDFDKIVSRIAMAFTGRTEYRILKDGTVYQKVT